VSVVDDRSFQRGLRREGYERYGMCGMIGFDGKNEVEVSGEERRELEVET
jgi:hypothetical protein